VLEGVKGSTGRAEDMNQDVGLASVVEPVIKPLHEGRLVNEPKRTKRVDVGKVLGEKERNSMSVWKFGHGEPTIPVTRCPLVREFVLGVDLPRKVPSDGDRAARRLI